MPQIRGLEAGEFGGWLKHSIGQTNSHTHPNAWDREQTGLFAQFAWAISSTSPENPMFSWGEPHSPRQTPRAGHPRDAQHLSMGETTRSH